MLGGSPSSVSSQPHVFVVGCPRSGTTLLQRMLDRHPQLAVANDSHFIPHAIELAGGPDPPLTPELVEWVRTYRRAARLGLPDEAFYRAAKGVATFAEFTSALYGEYARQHGKTLAGEKTPDYVRNLPLLHGMFPWARAIHIVRDGRDVALSAIEWAASDKGPGRIEIWAKEPVAVCALWWRRNVSLGREDAQHLEALRYREITYEGLVRNPETTLRDVSQALDLPFAPEMLAYNEGKRRDDLRLSSKSRWLPPTPGLRDWRTQMPERDVALFEALAGDLLSVLGYERAVDRIPAEVAEVAEECRRWWDSRIWRRISASRSTPALA